MPDEAATMSITQGYSSVVHILTRAIPNVRRCLCGDSFPQDRYRGGGSLIAMAEHRCGGLLMVGARVARGG
ncbi:hypothetical protein V6N13_088741 [Hibiscus sabdariffa]|uniref:Uncharacterized protein n=1 Tax=Hibiscus sabdariffa TaxID=183260 RepID=A0ABR2G0F5_9ROSI